MKRVLSMTLAAVLCITLCFVASISGVAETPDFSGFTAITNSAELKNIDTNLAGNYYLANDITITSDWEAIGWLDSDLPFTGIFDGNGKTISGLSMPYGSGATYVGLFAINGGTIKNLTVSGADVSGGTGVGAVVGVNKGIITNVTVKDSSVVGAATTTTNGIRIGGLVGQNGTAGTITECTVIDTYVEGNKMVGGVVGSNLGSVTLCTADGVEINNGMSIADIYADGAYFLVNKNTYVYSYAGGVVGNNQGNVSECATIGDIAVYGFEYVGGAIGYNSGTVTKIFMGSENHDIPYYNPYNYGSYTFYAEHVKLGIGYNEPEVSSAEDVYVITTHTAHTFGEWSIITPATCTEDGLKKRTCTDCGFKETAVIPAAHTEGEWTLATPASCTENGTEELRCTVCNEIIDIRAVAATGHTEGEWTLATPATCTENGTEELRCTVCNEIIDTRAVAATGHTEGEWTLVTPATCTENGTEELRCTVCNEIIDTRTVAATGHTEGEWTIVTPAACTQDGFKELRCAICGEVIGDETIPATGHTEGEWIIVRPATCTENGLKELHCAICDVMLDNEVITAPGHIDSDNDGACDECGTVTGNDTNRPDSLLERIIVWFAKIFLSMFSSLEGIC